MPTIAGVGRRLGGIERKRGLPAADEEHVLADAGADRVERHERAAGRLAGRGERLQDEQLDAGQVLVLVGRDDVADDAGELHRLSLGP